MVGVGESAVDPPTGVDEGQQTSIERLAAEPSELMAGPVGGSDDEERDEDEFSEELFLEGAALLQVLEDEHDNAPVPEVRDMPETRRARAKEIMGDLTRPSAGEPPRLVAEEATDDQKATVVAAEVNLLPNGRETSVGKAVLKLASLAAVDDPGLQAAYDALRRQSTSC